MSVKSSDIIDFLVAKKVNPHCPSCGKNNWFLPDDEQLFTSAIALNFQPNVLAVGGPTLPTIIMVCQDCGFIRSHAKLTIEEFIKARGGK